MSEIQRRHERFMQEALVEAKKAAEAGEVPIGCVVVRGDNIVGRGANEIERTSDPTRHAEVVAISDACSVLGSRYLDDCTLYVTLEPCAMCAGAMLLARVNTVVYATADAKSGAVHSLYELLQDPRMNHTCTVRTGFFEQESSQILKEFFATVRDAPTVASQELPAASSGKVLTLIPTPIGNIEDITVRGLKALKAADVIVCEDTRHTGQLLRRYGVQPKRLISNHDHNEKYRSSTIVDLIQQGKNVVLVSDAGTPGISDPGMRAVQECIAYGIAVVALPGATALTTAASASGLPTDTILFAGFPPQKKGRTQWLERMLNTRATIVLYEAPHRIETLCSELQELRGPHCAMVVARELTKIHEEYIRGSVEEVLSIVRKRGGLKGECVVLVEGHERHVERLPNEGDA